MRWSRANARCQHRRQRQSPPPLAEIELESESRASASADGSADGGEEGEMSADFVFYTTFWNLQSFLQSVVAAARRHVRAVTEPDLVAWATTAAQSNGPRAWVARRTALVDRRSTRE